VSRPVAVGLVGCGRIAERGYGAAIAGSAVLELAGVADPAVERRARLAPDVPGFDDAAELLASVELELVVVATPPALHVDVATLASAAGVRCLVEKPPAVDRAGAVALAALEPAPWLGFDRRFDPETARLRELALEQLPVDVDVSLTISPGRWAAHTESPGPLLDLGPHAVDLACWLTGRAPLRVRADGPADGAGAFVVELSGGSARIRVSHAGGWREEIRVGPDGSSALRRGGLVDRIRRTLARDPGPLVETLRAQLEAAGVAVRGGPADPRLASATDGVRVMATIDAASRAGDQPGAWVDVEL
jgi:predicted dehydrogenase